MLSGQRDAAQIVAGKGQDLFLLHGKEVTEHRIAGPSLHSAKSKATPAGFTRLETWQAIWDGFYEPSDAVGEIIETASIALNLLSGPQTSLDASRTVAQKLWVQRRK